MLTGVQVFEEVDGIPEAMEVFAERGAESEDSDEDDVDDERAKGDGEAMEVFLGEVGKEGAMENQQAQRVKIGDTVVESIEVERDGRIELEGRKEIVADEVQVKEVEGVKEIMEVEETKEVKEVEEIEKVEGSKEVGNSVNGIGVGVAGNKAVNGEEFKVNASEVMQTNIEETIIPKVGHAVAAVEHDVEDIGRRAVHADRLQAEVSTLLLMCSTVC